MRELRRHHDVEVSVAVDVGDGGVLGRRRVRSLGDGDVRPPVGVRGAEGDSHVALGVRHVVGVRHARVVLAVRLVHRHDVLVAVVVEVGHHEAVAAAQAEPGGGGLVDDVLAPTDVAAVRRPRDRGGIADEELRAGRLRPEPQEARDEEERGAVATIPKPHRRAGRVCSIESHRDPPRGLPFGVRFSRSRRSQSYTCPAGPAGVPLTRRRSAAEDAPRTTRRQSGGGRP